MIGLKTRIKEMKKLGMTEIKVDIETLEGLLEQSPEAGQVDAIVKRMGFEEVEYELEKTDVCDKCGEHPQRLFFGMRDYWDFREGEYWCADCIVKRYEADQKWIKEMDAKLEAECA